MADYSYRGSFFRFDWQNIGADVPNFDVHDFVYEMRYRLANEIKREAQIVKGRLDQVTQTWNHEVNFYYDISTSGDTFSFVITTKDEIFWYLNNGTDKRYAVMTKDFVPKTQPRVIGSRQGKGGFAYYVDFEVDGIEAREWIEEIAERREKYFPNNMSRLFNEIVEKYWRWAHEN